MESTAVSYITLPAAEVENLLMNAVRSPLLRDNYVLIKNVLLSCKKTLLQLKEAESEYLYDVRKTLVSAVTWKLNVLKKSLNKLELNCEYQKKKANIRLNIKILCTKFLKWCERNIPNKEVEDDVDCSLSKH